MEAQICISKVTSLSRPPPKAMGRRFKELRNKAEDDNYTWKLESIQKILTELVNQIAQSQTRVVTYYRFLRMLRVDSSSYPCNKV